MFLRHLSPGLVRIEALHLLKFRQGIWPKVLLVNDTVVTDDKRPHPGDVIYGGCSNQGEAADHDTLHHKIHFAERSGRALALQNPEKIAMIRVRLAGVAL